MFGISRHFLGKRFPQSIREYISLERQFIKFSLFFFHENILFAYEVLALLVTACTLPSLARIFDQI